VPRELAIDITAGRTRTRTQAANLDRLGEAWVLRIAIVLAIALLLWMTGALQ